MRHKGGREGGTHLRRGAGQNAPGLLDSGPEIIWLRLRSAAQSANRRAPLGLTKKKKRVSTTVASREASPARVSIDSSAATAAATQGLPNGSHRRQPEVPRSLPTRGSALDAFVGAAFSRRTRCSASSSSSR